MLFRPSGFYDASQGFGEIVGRVYDDLYGLSVLCVRIVQVNLQNQPHGPRWFSQDDVGQLVRRCIEAENIESGAYHGVSGNARGVWDLSATERDLGYRPSDGIR